MGVYDGKYLGAKMIEFQSSNIKIDDRLDTPMYLPLPDVEEHQGYFCWSLEEAIMTRIYYVEHHQLPSGDLVYAAILKYLGVKTNRPGERELTPCFKLAICLD